ncbi:MAG: SDR family oxidoreductase [Gammaproteobacteria bacterium]
MLTKKNPHILITGGGSGIGSELALQLSQTHRVIIVGRNIDKLLATQALNPTQIIAIQADIASQQGRQDIFEQLPTDCSISHLIHNAAIIEAEPLTSISPESWQRQMSTNIEAPLFLTQALLPYLAHGSRILFMSSKLAHEACVGIGAHCISKAALYMLHNCFKLELAALQIQVGSLRPGAVDTPTQEKVRSFPVNIFPMQPNFQALKENNNLQAAEKVANFISWVLLKTSHQDFSASEWNIYDTSHHQYWLENNIMQDAINLDTHQAAIIH